MKETWMKITALLCAIVMAFSFVQSGFAQEGSATGDTAETEGEMEAETELAADTELPETEAISETETNETESEYEESEDKVPEWIVVFDAGDGVFEEGDKTKSFSAMDGEYLENVGCYTAPTLAGKVFIGWSLDKNTKEIQDDLFVWYQVHQNVTLYAVWEEAYTITLDAGEGFFYEEDNKTETVKIKKEDMIGNLLVPQINQSAEKAFDCYCFDQDGNNPVPKDYVPDKDMTVYARWKGTYKVTFEAGDGDLYCGDGEAAKQKTILVGRGDALDSVYSSFHMFVHPYIDKKLKKAFKGWSTDPSGSSIIEEGKLIDIVPEGDLTLYAVWKDANEITYDAGEGVFYTGENVFTELVEKGEAINGSYPSDPEASDENKMFAGWSVDGTREGIVENIYEYVPSEDMTFQAVWADVYVITFDAGEGTIYMDDKVYTYTVKAGDVIGSEHPWDTPTISGRKVFAGWSYDGSREGIVEDFYEYYPSGDTTFYAVWDDAYLITLDAGEGYFYEEDNKTKTELLRKGDEIGSLLEWPSIDQSTGKVFDRYYLDREGRTPITYEFVPTGDITIYANWKGTYTVVFDAGEGTLPWGGGA